MWFHVWGPDFGQLYRDFMLFVWGFHGIYCIRFLRWGFRTPKVEDSGELLDLWCIYGFFLWGRPDMGFSPYFMGINHGVVQYVVCLAWHHGFLGIFRRPGNLWETRKSANNKRFMGFMGDLIRNLSVYRWLNHLFLWRGENAMNSP